MKKKSEIVNLLDELRSEDPKKRLNSVQSLKEIGAALGPAKARTEFIQFLAQFIDDEQHIVLQLLNQLSDFSAVLGGQQYEKCLLPLLIAFCKTDQKKQAEKATQIMESILPKNKDMIVDVIKKLSKAQMTTSKQSAIRLTSKLINLVPQLQGQLLEIYSSTIFCDIPAYRIIGARYLPKLLESVKNKEDVGKLIEVVYNDNDDLPKIFALEALVGYYSVSTNLVLSKFKTLFVVNNWRINIKICEVVPLAFKTLSKPHLKATFQASLLKFLDSPQPELRCKACSILKYLASIMAEQDIKKSLIPAIKRLSSDTVDYVKIQLSQHIVSLIQVCSPGLITQEILPIIFTFIKSNDLSIGIIKNFEAMSKKLSSDVIEQKILTPLATQFNTDNWKSKCRLIELLENVTGNSLFLNDKMVTMMVGLLCDRINAVREKATSLIVGIISQQSPQWCDNMIVPRLAVLKDSSNYIERQTFLQIVEKTADKVTDKTLNEHYRATVLNCLNDKVSNVRAKALKTLRSSKKLNDKLFDKYIDRLKNDADGQVKELALSMLRA